MKRIVALACAFAFTLTLFAATGCGDPCEKAFDQGVKCDKRDYSKSEKKKAKKEFVKMCKDSKALQKAAKKCAGISDCKKAKKCWRKSMKD